MVGTAPSLETVRATELLEAQGRAAALFDEVCRRGLIRAGVSEKVLSQQIHELAGEMFNVTRHWHKRVVRSGPNTLQPYRENPPDRVITGDDIVFLDFGPVFADWEADFGRTYVLGNDPVKLRLRDELAVAFAEGKRFFHGRADLTGAQLFSFVQALAQTMGWEYGGPHCGHLIGDFPHEKIVDDRVTSYLAPGNDLPMRRLDPLGRKMQWIFEVHFIDRQLQIGGFYEELLTLP